MEGTTPPPVKPSRLGLATRLIGVAVWAGLVTGLIEALWLWVNHMLRGRVIFTSDYHLWMTPLLYALIFAAVALGIAIVAMVVHPRLRLAHGVFVFVTMAVGCLFLPITQIARWAALIVALGAATQAARFTRDRPALALKLCRATLGVLVALAVAGQVSSALTRDSTTPGSVTDATLPNIVLVVWDTVRSENLSLYGYGEPTTPGLERLAEGAAVFDRAISPSPWTLPAHGSLFTGRLPHEMSTGWFERLDDAQPTLAEVLAANGYATGGFVANHHYTSYDSGLDRGFARYADYRPTWRQFILSSWFTQTRTGHGLVQSRSPADVWRALRLMDFWVGVKRANDRKHATTVNEELFAWLDEVENRPFFAFLNYFDAHAAYWSPPGTQELFGTEDPVIRAYDAAISYLDGQVTALVERLRDSGEFDNTIIVVTSDHGELFGENGLRGHAHNLYYRTVHVPLLIYAPQLIDRDEATLVPARIEAEVTIRDLPATLLEMAGIENRAGIGGRSLVDHWAALAATERTPPQADPIPTEVEEGRNNAPLEPISRGPMKSILSDGFHYILNGDGVEELYDYLGDPREETDLSTDLPSQPILERLRDAAADVWPDRVPRRR